MFSLLSRHYQRKTNIHNTIYFTTMIFRELYCLYKHSSINLIAKIIQMTSQKVSRCRMIIPRHGVIHIFWFHYPSRLFIFFTLFKHSSRHFSTGVITGAKTGGALRLIMSLRFTTIIIPVINSLTHTSENLFSFYCINHCLPYFVTSIN